MENFIQNQQRFVEQTLTEAPEDGYFDTEEVRESLAIKTEAAADVDTKCDERDSNQRESLYLASLAGDDTEKTTSDSLIGEPSDIKQEQTVNHFIY